MWPYWLMLGLPVWATLQPGRLRERQRALAWVVSACLFALFMGFRYQVGGDWYTYESHFAWIQGMSFREAVGGGKDPAYYGLSWLIGRAGGSIELLNLACASLLAAGAFALAARQRFPWLGIVAAVPYLFIVVGMGYTRQAAAIGLAMLALTALADGRQRGFVVWILLSAMFHKSAALLVPIAALSARSNRVWTASWVGVLTVLAVWLFLAERSEQFWNNYVVSEYSDASTGGPIRVAMNALPALLFLWLRKRLAPDLVERKLWTWMSVLALACAPFLAVSATAVDRISLYFIPLQIFVFARLPGIVPGVRPRTAIVIAIVAYYAAVQFVWLNFAQHAYAWLPYRFVPLW